MIKYIRILIINMILAATLYGANIIETNNITFTGNIIAPANALTNFSATFTPYIISFAISNSVNYSNGNYQFYQPTGTTTNFIMGGTTNFVTNLMWSLRLDLLVTNTSYTLYTNNLYFGTNYALGSGFTNVPGTGGVYIRTNGLVTPLLFDKPYNQVYPRVFNL